MYSGPSHDGACNAWWVQDFIPTLPQNGTQLLDYTLHHKIVDALKWLLFFLCSSFQVTIFFFLSNNNNYVFI